MFGIRALAARLFGHAATAPRPVRTRLNLDALEGREVPAFITWVNNPGAHPLGGDGQFGNKYNWNLANGGMGQRIPQTGDDVELVSPGVGGNLYGFGGSYNTIRLTAPLRVHLADGVEAKRLMVTNGSFNMTDATPVKVTGTTVPDARFTHHFQWTGGTLDDTPASPSNFHQTGGTASIVPGTGYGLQTAARLNFEGTVNASISTGTLSFTSPRTMIVKGSSTVSLKDIVLGANPNPDAIKLPAGDSQKFFADNAYADMGLWVAGGTAYMVGGGIVGFYGKVNSTPR